MRSGEVRTGGDIILVVLTFTVLVPYLYLRSLGIIARIEPATPPCNSLYSHDLPSCIVITLVAGALPIAPKSIIKSLIIQLLLPYGRRL